ncbi:Outer membrane receptor for ferrienterochelin and colicins [Porphyromonas cangingivalis]|uniref:TonB-dependent receptor domain-containing protein n=1 Tax=Porphyromonas cangingivalis TaxID=36874 RepID=UPI000D84F54E|nr:TonB-dependent receptor [Porphyromonas cangingivalis]SPY35184.1 Outer membrane receptor for ferrienterochelin and colicins [Porphyromonas cangingivalis]
MKSKYFSCILLTLLSLTAVAQEGGGRRFDVRVSGTTHSASDKAILPFTNVIISVVNGRDTLTYRQVSDKEGAFVIALPRAKEYLIEATFIGMRPYHGRLKTNGNKSDLNAGAIYLQEESIALKEAVVSAKRTLVKTSIDRLSYEMSADPTSKNESLLDALRKVPLVTVDGEGKIQIKGSNNYRIYMNGKPSNLFSKNAKDVLQSIPAGNIKKIEVITDPGVKYDAEGVSAILNIVTEGSKFEGYTGSVGINASSHPMGNANAYFSAKYGKFGVTTNLSSHFGRISGLPGESIRKTTESTITQDREMSINKMFGGFGNILLSYEIDSLNLININGNFNANTGEISIRSRENGFLNANPAHLLDINRSENLTRYGSGGGELSADFQHSTRKPGELLTLSYNYSYTPDIRDITVTNHGSKTPLPGFSDKGFYIQQSKVNGGLQEHTGQIDYTTPLGSRQVIEAGAKYIDRTSSSDPIYKHKLAPDGAWQEGSVHGEGIKNSVFEHTYRIGAAYFAYQYSTPKFSAKVGARLEAGEVRATFDKTPEADFSNKFFEWVPQLNLSYNLSMTSILKVGYNFRIQRPSIWHLNPFRTQMDELVVSTGNPNLKAERLHKLNIDYSAFTPKLSYMISVAYEFTDNAIETYTFKDGKYIHNTFGNIGKNKSIILNGYFMYNPTMWLRVFSNFNIAATHQKSTQLGLSRNIVSGTAMLGATATLPWEVMLNLNGGVFKTQQGIQTTYDPSYFTSVGLTKQMLGDKLTLNLSVQNPLQRYLTFSGTTKGEGFEHVEKNSFTGRAISFGITYKFGQMRSKVAKTRRTIHNDDLAPKQEQGGGSLPMQK